MRIRFSAVFAQIGIGCLLLFLAGCSGSGGSVSSNTPTGAITAKVTTASVPSPILQQPQGVVKKSAVATLPGVVTVRFTVSGTGMTGISKDFPVDNRRGTIESVPVGTGRVLTVQGLNASGAAVYAGSVSNITITEGQTSDVGTVTLQPVTPTNGFTTAMISGKTFTWTSSQTGNGSITYNADSTYKNTGYSEGWQNTGKWTINSAGVLILNNNDGTVDTITLASGSSSPLTATVTSQHSDGSAYVFTVTFTSSTGTTYSISGTITSGGSGLAGVVVSAGGYSATTLSDGSYTISGVPNGSYTVTPSKSGYTFTPASTTATVSNANITGQNFIATSTVSTSVVACNFLFTDHNACYEFYGAIDSSICPVSTTYTGSSCPTANLTGGVCTNTNPNLGVTYVKIYYYSPATSAQIQQVCNSEGLTWSPN